MGDVLQGWLAASEADLRWIEPGGYATRSYAGGDAGWMAEPQKAASVLGQANAALQSQILSVDILPALADSGLIADADDPLAAAENTLESEPATDNVRAVVQAVTRTLAAQVGVVLRLPSPLTLLQTCGATSENPPSADDLDDAADLLTGMIRQLSDFDLAGLMLATAADGEQAGDDCDSAASILAAARHYRWPAVLRLDGNATPASVADADIDAVLLSRSAPADLAAGLSEHGGHVGGGLGPAFWNGEDFPAMPAGTLYYGDAPGDVEPEQILERLRTLP